MIGYAFWTTAIAWLWCCTWCARSDPDSDKVEIEGPAFTPFLSNNPRAGMVWLPIRLFVGFAWLEAGWHKLTGTGWVDGGRPSGLLDVTPPRSRAGAGARRSPTSGIGASSTSSSPTTPRPGSRC